MLEDLQYYLLVIRTRLENKEDSELIVPEVIAIAIKNWVDTEGDPQLSRQQILTAIKRAIAKKGMNLN